MLDRAALHVPLSILMILMRTFISTYRICHVIVDERYTMMS
jgi:hypothetical protein